MVPLVVVVAAARLHGHAVAAEGQRSAIEAQPEAVLGTSLVGHALAVAHERTVRVGGLEPEHHGVVLFRRAGQCLLRQRDTLVLQAERPAARHGP